MRRKSLRVVALLAFVIAFAVLAAGCGTKHVNATSDSLACIFDGSQAGGHRFKKEVPAGDTFKTASDDQVVYLPTSNRFYNMTETANRDTLAPSSLTGYARGQVKMAVQGVLKFRFNTEGNQACEWYSKHGRRDANAAGDLGFNVRGAEAQAQAGWFRFLAEYPGDTMKQVVHDSLSPWTWQQLKYGNDPSLEGESDAALITPSVSIALGVKLGQVFTKYLDDNLGGHYFCGIQPDLTGKGDDPNCPPIYFQVISAEPADQQLVVEHDKLQEQQAQIATQQAENKLKAANRASLIEATESQRKLLEAQIENAALQARNDPTVQKCLIYAKVGLDCDGHRAPILVNGQPVGG